jgi:ATP-dependent DNA helicase RecQ
LCNYFQIAYGEGINESFAFSLNAFCVKYGFPTLKAYNAMQFLDRQGIVSLSQEFSEKITLQFIIESKEVIRYSSLNPHDEEMMMAILRTYPGIYELPTAFNVSLIAKSPTIPSRKSYSCCSDSRKRIVTYEVKNNDATLVFNEIREDEKTINRVAKYLENQNKLKIEQLQSVLHYAEDKTTCKSRLILLYFGETDTKDCGICSYCLSKKKKPPTPNRCRKK